MCSRCGRGLDDEGMAPLFNSVFFSWVNPINYTSGSHTPYGIVLFSHSIPNGAYFNQSVVAIGISLEDKDKLQF